MVGATASFSLRRPCLLGDEATPMSDTDALQALEKTCREYLADLIEPEELNLDARSTADRLEVKVGAPDEVDINASIVDIFFDIFYFLPLDTTHPTQYHFEWTSYSDAAYTKKAHHWVLETDVALMPDTGGFSQEVWEKFIAQFTYTKDGKPQELDFTPEFHDEAEESA